MQQEGWRSADLCHPPTVALGELSASPRGTGAPDTMGLPGLLTSRLGVSSNLWGEAQGCWSAFTLPGDCALGTTPCGAPSHLPPFSPKGAGLKQSFQRGASLLTGAVDLGRFQEWCPHFLPAEILASPSLFWKLPPFSWAILAIRSPVGSL